MEKMTLKQFIDSKAADIWDECKGNWIVLGRWDSHEKIAFFGVLPTEPFWDDDRQDWIWNDKNWEPDEGVELFTASTEGVELIDGDMPMWACKFPLNKSFGQTFNE